MQSVAESHTNPNNLRGGPLPPTGQILLPADARCGMPTGGFSFLVIEEEDFLGGAPAISTEAWDVLAEAIDEVLERWWVKYVVAGKGGT